MSNKAVKTPIYLNDIYKTLNLYWAAGKQVYKPKHEFVITAYLLLLEASGDVGLAWALSRERDSGFWRSTDLSEERVKLTYNTLDR